MRVSELAELKHGIQLRLTKPGSVSASIESVHEKPHYFFREVKLHEALIFFGEVK